MRKHYLILGFVLYCSLRSMYSLGEGDTRVIECHDTNTLYKNVSEKVEGSVFDQRKIYFRHPGMSWREWCPSIESPSFLSIPKLMDSTRGTCVTYQTDPRGKSTETVTYIDFFELKFTVSDGLLSPTFEETDKCRKVDGY